MHVEDPRWEEYEIRFRTLAGQVSLQKGPQPELASAEQFLFLYGDNGMSPEQEVALLSRFEKCPDKLKGTEILTAYWEDIALYLP